MAEKPLFYADGYRLEPGLVDTGLAFYLRGEETIQVLLPMVIAKELAQSLAQLVSIYEQRTQSSLPSVETLQRRLSEES